MARSSIVDKAWDIAAQRHVEGHKPVVCGFDQGRADRSQILIVNDTGKVVRIVDEDIYFREQMLKQNAALARSWRPSVLVGAWRRLTKGLRHGR